MNELAKTAHFFFEINNLTAIRIIERNDERWFVVKDVCDILGIDKPANVMRDFPKEECDVYNIHTTSSKICEVNNNHVTSVKSRARKTQKMLIVNEAGLYRLVFKSRKPIAKRFQTWVFNEVLPSIRKYGFYRASLPKIWPYRGKDQELTWGELVNKQGDRAWEKWLDGEKP